MQKIKLEIKDLGSSGEGIAHSGGKTFFVQFALPGEEVEAAVEKIKGNIVFAKATKILEESENRTTPPCPYFEKCGGCDIQHMKYESGLLLKQNITKNAIKKIAGLDANVLPCEKSEEILHYRNKISLPVKDNKIGLYEKNSHNIVEIKECLITKQFNKKLISILRDFLSKFENKNITHFVARCLGGRLLLTIVSKQPKVSGLEFLEKQISGEFKNYGINININKKPDAEILSNDFIYVCGIKQIEAEENGAKISLSSKSFFQVNDSVREKIYNYVCENVSGQTVIDAYSGVGILSSALSKKAKKVIAVEIEKSACKNAKQMLKDNKIKNVNVVCGDCKIEIPKLCKTEKADAVILDPPRAGCSADVLLAIAGARVPKIVYISCSPQTLARDIKMLKESYEIESIKPFDMFPWTHHVENVAVLTLKK